jgi:malonate transporter
MQAVERLLALTAPLFVLVFIGYGLNRWGHWSKAVSDALTRFVFAVAIPALLFRLMADFSLCRWNGRAIAAHPLAATPAW